MNTESGANRDQLIDRLNELNAIAERAYITGDRRARRIAVEDAEAIRDALSSNGDK